jgi:hypothetical protein
MGLMSEPSLGSAIEPHPVGAENLFLKNLPWLGLLSGSSQKKHMKHYALIFDAPSQDHAVEIARIHPGLHYGVTIELRDWTSPRETAPNRRHELDSRLLCR